MAASFIGGGNQSIWRKPTIFRKSLTKFIPWSCIEYTSPWAGLEPTTLVVIALNASVLFTVFVYLVVNNTCCVVFLLCLSSSSVHYVANFSGLPFLIAPSEFSNVYLNPTTIRSWPRRPHMYYTYQSYIQRFIRYVTIISLTFNKIKLPCDHNHDCPHMYHSYQSVIYIYLIPFAASI